MGKYSAASLPKVKPDSMLRRSIESQSTDIFDVGVASIRFGEGSAGASCA
jgi:hypothetical protein